MCVLLIEMWWTVSYMSFYNDINYLLCKTDTYNILRADLACRLVMFCKANDLINILEPFWHHPYKGRKVTSSYAISTAKIIITLTLVLCNGFTLLGVGQDHVH